MGEAIPKRIPSWLRRYVLTPLAAVLLLGLLLRVIAMIGYRPAYTAFSDTAAYAFHAAGDLASPDPLRPAGYPAFLQLVHAVSPTLTAVTVVQHMLGLATALLLYLTVRRFGSPTGVAVAAAAVVALAPDFILFEHAILTESLFLFLSVSALYAAAVAFDTQPDPDRGRAWIGWLAAAGTLLAMAAMVRAVGQVLIPVVALIAACAVQGGARQRVLAGATVGLPAVLLILAYSATLSASGGYFGLAKGAGWALYTRMAPIADCTRFDPPEGTELLCEASDPDTRPGSDYYAWHGDSPAHLIASGPPFEDELIGSFGRAALVGQPLDYLGLVLTDLARYVDAGAGPDREASGHPIQFYRFAGVSSPGPPDGPTVEYYGHFDWTITSLGRALGDVQQVVRVHGLLVLAAAILALWGIAAGTRRQRVGIVLLGGTALALMLVPVLVGTYDGRYGLTAYPQLVAAGLMGAWSVFELFRRPVGPKHPKDDV